MSDVFLSYKRDDEPKAGKLVAALEAEGFSVWWDRGLPGGEEWRAEIERGLAEARCVIVLWTQSSVSRDEGRFVRDEASRAYNRHILVPVLADRVAPPLGFGELQSIDLVHWRGSRTDPFFQDLVVAVRAKIEGRDVPPAKGPATRLFRRLRAGAAGGALIAAIAGFGMNALGVQDQVCRVPLGQPLVRHTCGSIGLGHLPTPQEEEERQAASGNCAAWRAIASDPEHFYNQDAAAILAAAIPIRAEDYTAHPREGRNYVRTAERPHATMDAARADALRRAEIDARELTCAPREFERLDAVDITSFSPDCRPDPRGGFNCAMDYVVQCRISERREVQSCQ